MTSHIKRSWRTWNQLAIECPLGLGLYSPVPRHCGVAHGLQLQALSPIASLGRSPLKLHGTPIVAAPGRTGGLLPVVDASSGSIAYLVLHSLGDRLRPPAPVLIFVAPRHLGLPPPLLGSVDVLWVPMGT
jgi:hypothetical protein